MNIIKNEIKKVFSLTNIMIVTIATVLIWILSISFEIEYFPNGNPATEHYNNAVYMLENYGSEMDENEFKEYKKYREEKVKEANEYLSNNEECIKLGMTTYKDYKSMKYKDDKHKKEIDELRNKIMFDDHIDVFWEIDAIDYEIDRYENKEDWMYATEEIANNQSLSDSQLNRHKELSNSNNSNSPFNFVVYENYNELIISVNVLIIITIAIIVSPIFIKDNKNKVNYLQYSSKVGRNIFNKKIISGIISSIIIITLQLSILFIIYTKNNTYMFWNCSINSVFNIIRSWYDITFGEYIILSVILTYILGIIISIISMFISSRVSTYISLIGIQVPIVFLVSKLIRSIGWMNWLTHTYRPKYFTHIVYFILIVISILIIYIMIKREKKLDIK